MNQRDLEDMMRRGGITIGPPPRPSWLRRLLGLFTNRHERKP